MHDSLRDALPVEVSQLLHKGGVVQEDRPAGPGGERVEPVAHRGAIGKGESLLVLKQ